MSDMTQELWTNVDQYFSSSLLGSDPNYLRTSNFDFSVRFGHTRVELPGR